MTVIIGPDAVRDAAAAYSLALGDDALIAAQRMGEWIAAAPQLEEDVALGNIGLDMLGQARTLLSYAGSLMDPPRTEDELAYLRDERWFRNVQLVERPWGEGQLDFAVAMTRLLVLSTYLHELYAALSRSIDPTLAGMAAKAVKEVAYHHDHARMWTLRLGDGTDESHARMVAALESEWPYVDELFDTAHIAPELIDDRVAVDPQSFRDAFDRRVTAILHEATLDVPEVTSAVTGGRRGVHTQQMGFLLAEMQHLARSHPGATW
ncbi:MAG: 1,2-phenylacetyl-CoA epoxidase subunit PaaC [Nocardioides sp.]